jgi:hypothetical protein
LVMNESIFTISRFFPIFTQISRFFPIFNSNFPILS